MIWLRSDFVQALPKLSDPFDYIMGLEGTLYKAANGRRTVRFSLNGRGYFLKAHSGVGWQEILKNLLQLKRPVTGARNEWLGIQRLQSLGVATTPLVGYGQRGWNPARRRSFVITEALPDTVSLEHFCREWGQSGPPAAAIPFKRALIRQVAEIARCLHENGINHRDFYLCHFLLDCSGGRVRRLEPPRLILIDLHRVQLRRATPRRWKIKDIGGLYFSSLDLGLTRRDLYRFIRAYRNRPLRDALRLPEEQAFWQAVRARACGMYRSCHSRKPVEP